MARTETCPLRTRCAASCWRSPWLSASFAASNSECGVSQVLRCWRISHSPRKPCGVPFIWIFCGGSIDSALLRWRLAAGWCYWWFSRAAQLNTWPVCMRLHAWERMMARASMAGQSHPGSTGIMNASSIQHSTVDPCTCFRCHLAVREASHYRNTEV